MCSHDHEKAKDYLDETKRWSTECAAYAEHMMKLQHRIPLLQGGPIPPPSNPPSASRPIIDLKPVELTSDSNMSVFHMVRVAPDCNRSYCEDSFSGYSGSVSYTHLTLPTICSV